LTAQIINIADGLLSFKKIAHGASAQFDLQCQATAVAVTWLQ
jgi:hypothetical protein